MDTKEKIKISAFVKAALGLLITAIVDFIVSFSTAYWATWSAPHIQKHGGYGLWKLWRCSLSPDQTDSREIMATKGFGMSDEVMKEQMGCEIKMADSTFPAWYVASQVLQTLGLASLVTSIVLLFVFMFVPRWTLHQGFMKSIIAVSYSAGIFTTVSLFVFGFKVAEEVEDMGAKDWALSWSFSLSCTACLLIQIAASVLVTESKRLSAAEIQDINSKYSEDDILQVALPENEKFISPDVYNYDDDPFEDTDELSGVVTSY